MTPEHRQLHRQAQCALYASVHATRSKEAAERALLQARSGPVSVATTAALHKAITALDKAIRLAENARRRALRKADRLDAH